MGETITAKKFYMRQREEEKHSDFSLLLTLQSPASAWLQPAGSSWGVVNDSLGSAVCRGHLPAAQSRAGEEQFLVLVFLFHLCCPFLSSFRICIFSLPYIAKALLPCQEILIRFLSHHLTLLFMPILYSFTISLVLLHLLAVALFCLFLCATASPHLSGYSLCGLHHAWVSQGLWVALQVERALQKCSMWTETGIWRTWRTKFWGPATHSACMSQPTPSFSQDAFDFLSSCCCVLNWPIHSTVSGPDSDAHGYPCQLTWCISSQPVDGLH